MAFRVLCFGKNVKPIAQTLENNFIRSMSSAGSNKNIGFIGLGNMGGHMANNLMKKVGINNTKLYIN